MEKPCVFLLPGLLCDEAVWRHQIDALSADYQLRVPVFRGFDSFREMARHVLAQAPARFSVAGHSMGARVALELMELAGERVEHLALLNFGAHPLAADEPARRQELLDLADREGLDAVAERLIPVMFAPENQYKPALLAAFRAMVRRNTVDDFKGQIRAALTRADQRPYLARIELPVLLLCGEQDGWSPVSQHQQSLALLRRGHLAVLPGAGHMSPLENPQGVNNLFFRWLKNISYNETAD